MSAAHVLPELLGVTLPAAASHKGQNGKALIIGGSDLFHAASQWSFLAASRWVDMVFFSSVHENNQLLHDAKLTARDGVVVSRADLPRYLTEIDSVLIGPGMRRDVATRFSPSDLAVLQASDLSDQDWQHDTEAITTLLLREFPEKHWIIDAGALQLLHFSFLPPQSILTPHWGEWETLLNRWEESGSSAFSTPFLSPQWRNQVQAAVHSLLDAWVRTQPRRESSPAVRLPDLWTAEHFSPELRLQLHQLSQAWGGATILLKGQLDLVWDDHSLVAVIGGNAGLTKGGSGDALAGMITAFRTHSNALASAVVASWLNKQASHELWYEQGLMYNTTDLVNQLPRTWKKLFA